MCVRARERERAFMRVYVCVRECMRVSVLVKLCMSCTTCVTVTDSDKAEANTVSTLCPSLTCTQ